MKWFTFIRHKDILHINKCCLFCITILQGETCSEGKKSYNQNMMQLGTGKAEVLNHSLCLITNFTLFLQYAC